MQHHHRYEAIDRLMEDLKRPDQLFDGVPTILRGDFAQILPVVKQGNSADTIQACL